MLLPYKSIESDDVGCCISKFYSYREGRSSTVNAPADIKDGAIDAGGTLPRFMFCPLMNEGNV